MFDFAQQIGKGRDGHYPFQMLVAAENGKGLLALSSPGGKEAQSLRLRERTGGVWETRKSRKKGGRG